MEKKIKKASILTGTLITGALLALTSNADARPATSKVLGNGTELRSEIIDLNITSSSANVYELKCGAEGTDAKKAESKDGKDKSAEAKCGEGKCGEGKCGSKDTDSTKVSSEKKDAKAVVATDAKSETTKEAKEAKDKTSEGKCGEGKCGESEQPHDSFLSLKDT